MPAGRAAILSKPNVVHPGLALLQNSTLWLDAGDAIKGAQWLRNKGAGGRALDARVGSVGSAQIINGALKLPGIAGNHATAPDVAALDITGDIDLIACAALIDWTPSTDAALVGKWGSTITLQSYILYIDSATGRLAYAQHNGSSAYSISTATTAHGITDGSVKWVRATRRQSDGNVKFYTSDNGSAWTQLGTTVVETTTNAIGNGTATLMVGNHNSAAAPLNGSVFRATVRNGYDGAGSIVFDADFTTATTLATSFTESSSNAATVTINSATGVDTNDPLLLPHAGTNYLYGSANVIYSPVSGSLVNPVVTIQMQTSQTEAATGSTAVGAFGRGTGSGGAFSDWGVFLGGSVGGNAWMLQGLGAGVGGVAVPQAVRDATGVWYRYSRNDATGTVTYEYSTDGSSWTSAGSASSGAGALGSAYGFFIYGGPVYNNLSPMGWRRVTVTSSGSTALDANFTAQTNGGLTSFTESSSNAATVTINRAATGRKAVMVTRPTLLFGTDDYLEIPDSDLLDFGLSDSFTVMSIYRKFGVGYTSVAGFIVAKQDSVAVNGWRMGYDNTIEGMTIRGPSAIAASRTPQASGLRALSSVVRNVIADNLTPYENATAGTPISDTTTVTLANSMPVRVGRMSGSDSYYADAEIEHVMIFRSALTSVELGHIAAYLGAI